LDFFISGVNSDLFTQEHPKTPKPQMIWRDIKLVDII
jgi:hypothetical protein